MQSRFDKAYDLVSRLGKRPGARRFIDRLFARWVPDTTKEHLDWVSDAEWARLHQEPLRARVILRGILVVLAILIVWAAFAQVDEFTRGTGKVIPSKQLQILQ